MRAESGKISIWTLLLILVVAGGVWNLWSQHGAAIYEHFRTKQPADLVAASGYDYQASKLPSFFSEGDPQPGHDQISVQRRKARETFFDPRRITTDMIRNLEGQLRQAELNDGLAWLKSPLGTKIVTLEKHAVTVGAHNTIQLLASQTLPQQARAERIALVTELIQTLKPLPDEQLLVFPHRLAVNLALTQVFVGNKLQRVGIVGRGLSYAYDINGEALYHQFVTALIFAYQDLSDDELRDYLTYLKSPAGRKLTFTLCRAYQEALANALTLYAEVLPEGLRHNLVLVNPVPILNVTIEKFGIVTPAPPRDGGPPHEPTYVTTETLPEIAEQTSRVLASLQQQFGVYYSVHGESGSRRVPVTVRILHPPMRDPQTGSIRTTHEWTALPRLGRKAFAGWTFHSAETLVPGRWLVQIRYQDEPLAEQVFEVENHQPPVIDTPGAATAAELAPAELRMAQINTWALAPGGRHLLLLGTDQRLVIWDLETGKSLLEPVELGSSRLPFPRFAVDPRGRYVLTSTQDQRLQIRLLESGVLAQTLEETAAGYRTMAMAISSSGTYILTLHDDDQLPEISSVAAVTRIWRATDGARIARIVDCDRPVIDPREHYVAGVSRNNKIVAYDLKTGRRLFTASRKKPPAGQGKILTLLPSPAGNRILALYSDGRGLLLDSRSGRIVSEVELSPRPLETSDEQWLKFDPSGRYFFFAKINLFSRIWSTETGSLVCTIQSSRGSSSDASAIWIHPQQPRAVVLLRSEALLYDLADGHLLRVDSSDDLQYGNAVGALAPSFRHLVTVRSGDIKILDLVDGTPLDDFGRGGKIFSLQADASAAPYGYPVIQTDETDGSFHLWNPFTGAPISDPALALDHYELQVQNGRAVTLQDPTRIRVRDLTNNRFHTIQIVTQK